MKRNFKLFRRGMVFYSEEIGTGKRKSLKTGNKREAEQILAAQNATHGNAALRFKMAEAFLSTVDKRLTERKWEDVIREFSEHGGESTIERKKRVFRNPAFEELKTKKILETTPEDFFHVTRHRTTAVILYLQQIQNYSLDLGYLLQPVLPSKRFPRPLHKQTKRAITRDEHRMFLDAEKNEERRAFYEMLWWTGAAQSDCADLQAEDFDLKLEVLVFTRQKTKSICRLHFGDGVKSLLLRLPRSGYLFPKMREGTWRTRAAEFGRRRRLLKLSGISLHSYRYAWAERAYKAGIPERLAMSALGHGSKAITRAYARSAEVICPVIDGANELI